MASSAEKDLADCFRRVAEKLRSQANLPKRVLAERIGEDPAYLTAYLNGRRMRRKKLQMKSILWILAVFRQGQFSQSKKTPT